LSTVLFGGAVGRVARWRELAAATIAGTCALLFWYAVAMVSQPDPNGNNDQAAGAGAVILGVPTLIVVASLLCAGRGLGRWSARRSRPQGA